MKGADEFYDLFNGKSLQIGRLFLQMHRHARGKCFEIFLVPEGVKVTSDYANGKDNVEIYGMTGGQRGWTETYGWLYKGKWQNDFEAIVQKQKSYRVAAMKKIRVAEGLEVASEKSRVDSLLSSYA